MNKINFTAEHLAELRSLVADYVLAQKTIINQMGQSFGVEDLLNSSLRSLSNLKSHLSKKIDAISEKDDWDMSDTESTVLTNLRNDKSLIHLIIGFKKDAEYKASIESRKESLQKQIEEIKEASLTPEERIKKLSEELNTLE